MRAVYYSYWVGVGSPIFKGDGNEPFIFTDAVIFMSNILFGCQPTLLLYFAYLLLLSNLSIQLANQYNPSGLNYIQPQAILFNSMILLNYIQ